MDMDTQTRDVQVKDDKKRKGADAGTIGSKALGFVLADKTGAALFTVWDSVADAALKLGSSVLGQEKKLLFDLEKLRVGEMQKSEFNGTILTTMHKIQSVRGFGVQAGTWVSTNKHATSPFCRADVLYKVPASPICIHDYSKHWQQMVAPFRASFAGIVDNVENVDITGRGQHKRQFDLIDGKGNAIVFYAIGRNAVNRCLLLGTEVVVYNGTGRSSLGSADGGVYLLKDANGKRGSQTKEVRTLVA